MLIIWVTSHFLLFNALTLILVDIPLTLISGFITSFLISKDVIPLNIPFFFKNDDTAINRRMKSGVFSSTVFILIFFNVSFVLFLLDIRPNILFAVGFYLFGLIIHLILGFTIGLFGGKAGVAVRDNF